MGKKLYVGNLSYQMTDSGLQDAFSAFGTVESAKVIMDRDSGRSKGFGFVEMSSSEEANNAITVSARSPFILPLSAAIVDSRSYRG